MTSRAAPGKRTLTPLFLQSHITECGAACLGSVLAYFGRWVSLNELRDLCGVGRDGSTAAGILRAATHYGLRGSGKTVTVSQVSRMGTPLILFWEFNHFVVLEGCGHNRFYLNDPAAGRRTVTLEEFTRSFTGVVLRLEPGPEFERGGAGKSVLGMLSSWIGDARGAFAFAALYGLILTLFALATPALSAVFVDRVLIDGEPWGWFLGAALAGSAIAVFWLTWLKHRYLSRLAVRISIIAGNRCISKMLRLPLEFFNHRHTIELTGRMISIDRISSGLALQFTGLLIEVAMSTVFFAVVLFYDAVIAGTVLCLVLVNLALMHMVAKRRSEKGQTLRRESELSLSAGAMMLERAEILRIRAEDDNFFTRWAGLQSREFAAYRRFSELGHILASLPMLMLTLSHAVVLSIGATRVLEGELTLGLLVGIYILTGMILSPVRRFIEFINDRQVLETALQRLEDIADLPEPPALTRRRQAGQSVATLNGRLQLTGRVELRDVTFGYSPGRPPLIRNLNLTIDPGQRVALVGPSGSGKSTVSRLVSGVFQPWSGEILFDGLPREDIPDEVLSRSLSLVDQNTTLFSGTVRDNITLWNPAVPDEMLAEAARDACVHDFIVSQPLGYSTPVDTKGNNFSGGQRQRMDIARALIGNPVLLILDEATSALDAATEEAIDDALRRRGVSCLIIAHRLSTIRDADTIIVLDRGEEVQRGTHEALYADRQGLYYRLIQAD